MLKGLQAKGYIDSALYLSRSNEIERSVRELRSQKGRVCNGTDDDAIRRTKEILALLEEGLVRIDGFSSILFCGPVEKITALDDRAVRFHLYGGLGLTETVGEPDYEP